MERNEYRTIMRNEAQEDVIKSQKALNDIFKKIEEADKKGGIELSCKVQDENWEEIEFLINKIDSCKRTIRICDFNDKFRM